MHLLLELSSNYNKLSSILEDELSKRFGVSENINSKVYEIVLEFSMSTGEFVSRFFFHHSQEFCIHNGVMRMHLRCGINRELVGWLFTWMTNVRIISPQKLKDLYVYMLQQTLDRVNSNSKLRYENYFFPMSY